MTLWTVAELHEHLGDPDLRVVDVRWTLGQPGVGRAAYDAGHIPGAIHLNVDTDLADPDGFGAPGRHPLPEPAAFATRLGALGIGSDDTIVAYDDVGGGYAARLWWMLDDLGHRDVHLLDGGVGAWTAAGLPLTTDIPSWPSATLALATDGATSSTATRSSTVSVRSSSWTPEHRNATGARSSRSTPWPATSLPP